MSEPAAVSDHRSWNTILSYISDPTEQATLGAKSLVVVAISVVVALGGVALALTGVKRRGRLPLRGGCRSGRGLAVDRREPARRGEVSRRRPDRDHRR